MIIKLFVKRLWKERGYKVSLGNDPFANKNLSWIGSSKSEIKSEKQLSQLYLLIVSTSKLLSK